MHFRLLIVLFGIVLCAIPPAAAHGPQIQITKTNDKIVTRALIPDGSYIAPTEPKTVYVMPALSFNNAWYSRPNGAINPTTLLPSFPSGPGLAFGSDLADGGPQDFEVGSVLSVGFVDGLKRWNGSSFVDAGATQLKAFRGSNVDIASPAANFAVTSNIAPFDSLSLDPIILNYSATESANVHSSLRFALLGDGASPTSASPDGIYLLKMQLSSTQAGLSASEPYYFVLKKNSSSAELTAAVNSLNISAALVQWVVPEPGSIALAAIALVFSAGCRSSRFGREQTS